MVLPVDGESDESETDEKKVEIVFDTEKKLDSGYW